jgi:hypothetical protein
VAVERGVIVLAGYPPGKGIDRPRPVAVNLQFPVFSDQDFVCLTGYEQAFYSKSLTWFYIIGESLS